MILEFFAAMAAVAAAPQGAGQGPANYDDATNWLCRPDREDACAADLSSTIVAADGKLTPAQFRLAKDAAVDCFYVYPTISLDQSPNSDLVPGLEEQAVIANQFARFGEVCRTFAPMYRQVTIPALRSGMAGAPMPGIDRELGYADVLAAWRHYLARDNKGRGVILIGHSQGSGVLKRLIAEQIDGKPDQARIIGAYLIGTNLLVPNEKTVGGDFKSLPICTQAGEVGCAISYVSFRSNVPPPAKTRFGRTDAPGMQVACVNPAAVGEDRAATVKSYLGNRPAISSSQLPPKPWVAGKAVSTPFVQTPGLLTAACTTEGSARYLKVTVNAVPGDPRTDEISGDVINDGQPAADWGLHVIDVNLAMGDLLDVARAQSRAYLARR
ncbi:DUF3089 domain-containing protein [Sphingomonas mucosissima]|uniref:DUF3089 domain-containing protein n=1 Tax=Sphingomonas mucosissima TaxID=370959 RepID=A0A245ZE26_9SPHN|nr:DUF3089 domain-containing protein [Sphingomonas mucosissima]OWK27988.1 hypothetical protein SPMU_32330 [Sphingomonas mucosissima]